MIDRAVAVVCTGHGSHALRELFVLIPIRPRADLALIRREAREAGQDAPDPEPSAGELRGFGLAGSSVRVGPDYDGRLRHWVRRKNEDARLLQRPDGEWVVVHPGCPNCKGHVWLPVAHVAASLALDPPGTSRVERDVRPPGGLS